MSHPLQLSFLNAMGGSIYEIVVILTAILLLFGAKALPNTLRTLGRWSEQLRRISLDLQREIQDAGEPFDDARREWDAGTRDLTVSSAPRPTDNGKPDKQPDNSTAETSSDESPAPGDKPA